MPEREVITGLDIGTSKVCAIVGEIGQFDQVNIIGVGTSPSRGLKKGIVVNLDKTIHAIMMAVDSAQRMAGIAIDSVYVGVAGGHISSFNSHGVVAIANPEEITKRDVNRVIDAAKVVAIPDDRRIIHVLPREFTVDSCRGIKDPEGMAAKRLEVVVHIVTGAAAALQNVVKCVERAGLSVNDLILQPLASSTSVLTPDEQEYGTVLIDIGGGTTDLAVVYEGSIILTAVIPVGGNHFTNDLAFGLRVPFSEAERLKMQYSQSLPEPFKGGFAATGSGDHDFFRYNTVDTTEVYQDKMSAIIQPRAEELFLLVQQRLSSLAELGVVPIQCVITGGASQLWGMETAARTVLGLPVRVGSPENVSGLVDFVSSPIYATGIGLIQYANQNLSLQPPSPSTNAGFWADLVLRVKSWFKDFYSVE